MKLIVKFYFFFLVLSFSYNYSKNIGLCIVATGKYVQFVPALIKSADKFFCNDHNVIYFVFTDQEFADSKKSVKVFQKRLGWPYDTLMRFEIYNNNRKLFDSLDYVFACDADMLFVNIVGDEILGKRVATLHPGYTGSFAKRGTYDTNALSTACVASHEGEYYYAGGFYGGEKEEFVRMISQISLKINIDLEKKYIAIWHDESHLNRYFIDNPPTVTLSPSYCYPESWQLPYEKKLLALDKNHVQYREA